MELYEEKTTTSNSKFPMFIKVIIIVLIILMALILYAIIYLKNSITTINIDSKNNTEIEEMLYITAGENGNELYFPIIKMAKFLNYEGFTGDYEDKSEDKTKCHVVSENEIAMFSKDSDILVKVTKNSEYEYVKLDKPVFEKDGQLYVAIDGMQKAFNILISSDSKFKNIDIYTMEYLVDYYANKLKIQNYSKEFNDQKSIFQNMLIVQENERYGVINIENGKAILESKYEEIKYLPSTENFLVKNNAKYGIINKDTSIQIRIGYDEIKQIDNQNKLYLVKQNNAYGILNAEGKVIIDVSYKQIGISSKYTQNGVENNYVLLNEIIPIKNNQDLWGLFNVEGKQLTEFKYTGIGCESTPESNTYPAVVIPSHKIIVVKAGEKYNLVNTEGKEKIPSNILGAVYLKVNATTGENEFFMTSTDNTKRISIEEWLTSIE